MKKASVNLLALVMMLSLVACGVNAPTKEVENTVAIENGNNNSIAVEETFSTEITENIFDIIEYGVDNFKISDMEQLLGKDYYAENFTAGVDYCFRYLNYELFGYNGTITFYFQNLEYTYED